MQHIQVGTNAVVDVHDLRDVKRSFRTEPGDLMCGLKAYTVYLIKLYHYNVEQPVILDFFNKNKRDTIFEQLQKALLERKQ